MKKSSREEMKKSSREETRSSVTTGDDRDADASSMYMHWNFGMEPEEDWNHCLTNDDFGDFGDW